MRHVVFAFAFVVAGFAQDINTPTYSGPAILSRGTGATVSTTGDLMAVRPYFSVSGIYDGGLTPVSVDTVGALTQYNGSGVEVGFGAQGFKRWRRTLLGLDYSGTYRHYPKQQFFNGTDQQFGLSLSHDLSRRWSANVRTVAGTLMRGYVLTSALGSIDDQNAYVSLNDPFDNRMTFANSVGSFTYSPSLRWSFNFGGGGFIVRRRSASLFSSNGVTARGDIAYRISRRQTLGIAYNHNYWKFTRSYGESTFDYVSLNYAVLLSKNTELGLQAGVYRTNSKGIGTVQLDPAIAAILGTSTGYIAFDRTNYLPGFALRLVRSWKRTSLAFTGSNTITPGNSMFLTSRQQSAGVSYNFNASRDWSFNVFADYSSFSALMQGPQKQKSYAGGVGLSRRIVRFLQFSADAQIRRIDITPQSQFSRNFLRVSAGLVFAPGEFPISAW